ncbi:MAG: di-trans,poly-cis-decaprenylcistransferase [Candidatus Kerfeldbacteria bacterium]|nr:di-trans,poly-cis-decaprenylcistransferase [Candidatus Kerfeldbacteria bacterium]
MAVSSHIPRHVGIIMDGNRRWARARGLPALEGHRRGYEKMKAVGDWALEVGIEYLTVFAFSTENWNRTKREVSYLMRLLKRAFERDLNYFHERGIKLRFLGRWRGLPADVQRATRAAVRKTAGNTRATFSVCINYGGRHEIVDAVRAIVRARVPAGRITPATISHALYASDLPNPDLIIRTSGEQRLSGFLTWQSAYSELLFVKQHWPAFSKQDFHAALQAYARRQRRYGR